MELFFKTAAAAIVTAVLTLVLSKQGKEFSLLLGMAGCALAGAALLHFLEPVLDFVSKLQILGDLNGSMLLILLKTLGIGLVSELAAMICTDSGNASLAKTVQLLGSVVILWLSIPIFQMLLDLMESILGGL